MLLTRFCLVALTLLVAVPGIAQDPATAAGQPQAPPCWRSRPPSRR